MPSASKNVKFTAQHDNPSYHPGRCAVISIDGVEVGVMGQLHPLVNENYNVEQPMFAAEIHLDTLLAARPQGMHYKRCPNSPLWSETSQWSATGACRWPTWRTASARQAAG